MPRSLRLDLAGCTHHVIQRGNNRQPVFLADEDRRRFLEWLGLAVVAEGAALHAYVLMTNHFHLLLSVARQAGLGRLMQSLGRRYVAHVNRRYGRTGTLWEGRYKSTILDSERYVLACHRYIEANPVRAGLAAAPQDYPWSSHCANAYGVFDPLLAEHETYRALGAGPGARQSAYRALFAQELDPRLLDELRDATQRGWVPGSAAFRGAIEAALGRPAGPRRRGRPPKPAADRDQRGGGSRPDARVPSDLGEK